MSGSGQAVEAFDLVIFGGTGDLALRKLLPALWHRYADGQIRDGSRILALGREAIDETTYRQRVRAALDRNAVVAADALARERFLALVEYHALDATDVAGWRDLAARLAAAPPRVRVFYLATSAELYVPICERLRELELTAGEVRVVLEKPLGSDLASATAINTAVGRAFAERQTFRIDHYLGKETVQNLIALRFGNALFEPLWRAEHIDHVQITVAETVGVEGRAGYYANAGALRDMVQNHLLQLLCMVAMEPPPALDADAIRDEKLKVLRALAPIDATNAGRLPVRGQRWAGVPFYLRTGKRLADRVSEIVVAFRAIPHSIFGAAAGPIAPNKLVLRLQPDEGVKLWLMLKHPGPGGLRLRRVPLDMSFAEAFGVRHPDAYERLLLDVVRGNPTLFMRRDEVEAAWRWIDPILAAWEASGELPKPYTAGTWGPSAAVALIERDGRTWHDD